MSGELTRILMVGDAVGGVWRYSLDLAHGCAEHGIEAVLAVVGPPPSASQAEAAAAAQVRVVLTGLPLDWTARDLAELRGAGAALAGLADRLRVDTVHLHTPALAAEVAWSVPVVAAVHSCVGTWWRAVRGGPIPEDFAWRAGAVGRGLAEADAIIAPSRSLARALAGLYRPGRPITVVPNGRRPIPLPATPRHRAVLTAGRLWDEGKNIAVLDRAAPLLDAPVLAAGPLEGPNGAAAGELPHLHLLGLLDDAELAACMAEATVFAAPSRYEPFGLAVLEAAQSGMALALADIPTFREIWEGAALFFHPEDSAGLADTARRLLDRPEGAARRARDAAARYSVQAMIEATLAVHRSLASAASA